MKGASICTVILTLVGELVLVLLASFIAVGNPNKTTREGASAQIERLADLTKWMAALETAILGGLAYALFSADSPLVTRVSPLQQTLMAIAAANLGTALLTCGWVFTSLGSITARLYGREEPEPCSSYDVTDWSLYGSRLDNPAFVKLGYLVTVKHWFWGLGLASVAVLTISLLHSPPAEPQKHAVICAGTEQQKSPASSHE